MKKIALITPGIFPVPSVLGGAMEKHFEDLARRNEMCQRTHFVIVSRWHREAEHYAEAFEHSTFHYVKDDTIFHKNAFFICRLLNKLFRILFKTEPFSYSHYYRCALSYAVQEGCETVVFGGGRWNACFASFLKNYTPEQLFLYINGNLFPTDTLSRTIGNIITVSAFIEKEYLSTCSNPALHHHVLYTGINEEVFGQILQLERRRELRAKFGFCENDFVVVFCGRVSSEKGVLELMRSILAANGNVKLLIVGSHQYGSTATSSYVAEVEKLATEHNEKIQFTGYIKNQDLWELYQSADCQAVPSLWDEPSGTVVVEGLWSGLPLVVTNSGGIPEYLNEQCAFILERGDSLVSNMTAIFNKLSQDGALCQRMSIASRKQASQFSMEKYYDNFLDIVL